MLPYHCWFLYIIWDNFFLVKRMPKDIVVTRYRRQSNAALQLSQLETERLMAWLVWSSDSQPRKKDGLLTTRWWFQIFFVFTPIWGRFPFWRAYFSNRLKPPNRLCWLWGDPLFFCKGIILIILPPTCLEDLGFSLGIPILNQIVWHGMGWISCLQLQYPTINEWHVSSEGSSEGSQPKFWSFNSKAWLGCILGDFSRYWLESTNRGVQSRGPYTCGFGQFFQPHPSHLELTKSTGRPCIHRCSWVM